ncbi:MAG: outer membrane beta-barrel protein [Gemmatimonadaceae bacterium]|nr:outer membrane beta-barrel protein [Gemmatimonadaceae bacterium]
MHPFLNVGLSSVRNVTRLMTFAAMLAAATLHPRLSLEAQSASDNKQLRQGFWISVGAGAGSLGCDNCGDDRENGGAAQIALGGTLSQHFQLGASINAWSKETQGITTTFGTLTLLGKLYPSARLGFYLSGGLGVGRLEFSGTGMSISDKGRAGILGVGYDIRVAKNFSITPFLNGATASIEGNGTNITQLGISLTWH